MPYTTEQLDLLRKALATGERCVSFGDKTVEYRSVAELRAAIREGGTGKPLVRQIRVTTSKGPPAAAANFPGAFHTPFLHLQLELRRRPRIS